MALQALVLSIGIGIGWDLLRTTWYFHPFQQMRPLIYKCLWSVRATFSQQDTQTQTHTDYDARFFAASSQCNFSSPSEDLSCPNERYLLYREWAHPRSIYKKQPLDLIRWVLWWAVQWEGLRVALVVSKRDSPLRVLPTREAHCSYEFCCPEFLLGPHY